MYCPNPECPDFKETGSPGEYVEGITICPFCGSELVEVMPSMSPAEDPDETELAEDESNTNESADEEPSTREDSDEEPRTRDYSDEELVVVATFNFRPDADLMMTFLLNQGIDVFESPDDCGGTNPAVGFGVGIRLLVPKSQADEATALIDDVEKSS